MSHRNENDPPGGAAPGISLLRFNDCAITDDADAFSPGCLGGSVDSNPGMSRRSGTRVEQGPAALAQLPVVSFIQILRLLMPLSESLPEASRFRSPVLVRSASAA